jgi:hypothetical protein
MVELTTVRAFLMGARRALLPRYRGPIASSAEIFVKTLQIPDRELFYGSQWQNLGNLGAKLLADCGLERYYVAESRVNGRLPTLVVVCMYDVRVMVCLRP